MTAKHVEEIFEHFGTIEKIIMPMDKHHPNFCTGSCEIIYKSEKYAVEAERSMHKGQIDGKTIAIKLVWFSYFIFNENNFVIIWPWFLIYLRKNLYFESFLIEN